MSRLRLSPSGKFITTTLSVSGVDFPSVPANSTVDLVVPIVGAVVGQAASWGPLGAALVSGLVPGGAFVATAGNVTLRLANETAAPIDPASTTVFVTLTTV